MFLISCNYREVGDDPGTAAGAQDGFGCRKVARRTPTAVRRGNGKKGSLSWMPRTLQTDSGLRTSLWGKMKKYDSQRFITKSSSHLRCKNVLLAFVLWIVRVATVQTVRLRVLIRLTARHLFFFM